MHGRSPAAADAGSELGRELGGIEQLTSAFVESLPFPEGDPREILGQLVVELARRVDHDGAVPATVRELRTLLVQLAEIPNQAPGQVDELRLKRAQRRLDGLLAQAV